MTTAPCVGAASSALVPPLEKFTSPKGRIFTVGSGERDERFPGDALWSDVFPVLLDGKQAGKLFLNFNYSRNDGPPRWQGTLNELRWDRLALTSVPLRCGFDVAAFDTAEECAAAWARSADEILDWSATQEAT